MLYSALLRTERAEHYDTVKARIRSESALAYALLNALYLKIYGSPSPKIKRLDGGKPCFVGAGAPSFNISHTEGAVLAVIDTDGADIGADIQSAIKPDMASRLLERYDFLSSVKAGAAIDNLVFLVAERGENGELSFSELSTPLCEKASSFEARWTLCEALLKADGGGFRSVSKIGSFSEYKSLTFTPFADITASVVILAPKKTLDI